MFSSFIEAVESIVEDVDCCRYIMCSRELKFCRSC